MGHLASSFIDQLLDYKDHLPEQLTVPMLNIDSLRGRPSVGDRRLLDQMMAMILGLRLLSSGARHVKVIIFTRANIQNLTNRIHRGLSCIDRYTRTLTYPHHDSLVNFTIGSSRKGQCASFGIQFFPLEFLLIN